MHTYLKAYKEERIEIFLKKLILGVTFHSAFLRSESFVWHYVRHYLILNIVELYALALAGMLGGSARPNRGFEIVHREVVVGLTAFWCS